MVFVAARQGAQAKVLEQSRTAKEGRIQYFTRGKKDGDDKHGGGPEPGDKKPDRARGKP